MLIRDINRLVRKAKKLGLMAAIRLNGTTDVKWESTPVVINGIKYADNIMSLYSDAIFYDYTALPYAKRPNESLPLTII